MLRNAYNRCSNASLLAGVISTNPDEGLTQKVVFSVAPHAATPRGHWPRYPVFVRSRVTCCTTTLSHNIVQQVFTIFSRTLILPAMFVHHLIKFHTTLTGVLLLPALIGLKQAVLPEVHIIH